MKKKILAPSKGLQPSGFVEMSLCGPISFIFFKILVIYNSTNNIQLTFMAYLELEVSNIL
jgi:hypothetical protein